MVSPAIRDNRFSKWTRFWGGKRAKSLCSARNIRGWQMLRDAEIA